MILFSRIIINVIILKQLVASGDVNIICYSPAGRSVLGETVPGILITAGGQNKTLQHDGHDF